MSARLGGALFGGALLGKLLGFARETAMARFLGATLVADSFRGGLTAVLLPVAPLQNDIMPSVLIPLHRGWAADGQQALRSAALAILVTAVATAAALAVFLAAAPWVGLLVGRFGPDAQALTVRFTEVMALAIPPSVLSASLGSIEIATGRSRIATVRASVQNLSLMAGIGVMAAGGPVMAIAWSFVLGFAAMAAYGVLTLAREGALTLRGLRVGTVAAVGLEFWRRMRPLLAIPLAEQGNIFLERFLASGLAIGALASLDYARTLTESAFYLVSQPVGYVMLTRVATGPKDVAGEVGRLSRPLLALGLPASAFLAVFAPDIVQVVFARGAFDAHATALTAAALRGIAVGLWASTLGWVLLRLLNTAGRNGTAALVVVSAFAANAAFNAVAAPALGPFGLGLGEAVRGVVLLGGTAAALGCTGSVLRCVGRAGAMVLPLAAAACAIGQTWTAPLIRLAVAAPLFGLATAAWLAWLLPGPWRRLVQWPRRAMAGG